MDEIVIQKISREMVGLRAHDAMEYAKQYAQETRWEFYDDDANQQRAPALGHRMIVILQGGIVQAVAFQN